MNQPMQDDAAKGGTPGTPHTLTVYVNTRPREIEKRDYAFREVVALAFENPVFDNKIVYTVTFKRAHGDKPEGTLVEGDLLKPKEGTQINVIRTDKS